MTLTRCSRCVIVALHIHRPKLSKCCVGLTTPRTLSSESHKNFNRSYLLRANKWHLQSSLQLFKSYLNYFLAKTSSHNLPSENGYSPNIIIKQLWNSVELSLWLEQKYWGKNNRNIRILCCRRERLSTIGKRTLKLWEWGKEKVWSIWDTRDFPLQKQTSVSKYIQVSLLLMFSIPVQNDVDLPP